MHVLLLVVLASTAVVSAETPSDWNQWRGPTRDGHAPGEPWPERLDGLERSWHVPLGRGYGGPIVTADRVFVVETVDDESVGVRALDRADGSELWRRRWPGRGSVPFFAKRNGDWVRSTPAWDGKTLYVGDMSEVLVALDGETGEPRWRVDVPARFGTKPPDFGFASSPLVDGEHVYVQAANSLLKLDRATGETVWRRLEHSGAIKASGAFSSPVIATIGGVRQLVVLTRHELYGLDPDDGSTLWSQPVPSFRGMNIMTPVVHGNLVYTSPYRQKTFGYAIERGDTGFEVREAWSLPSTGYMSTPVVVDGHAYVHLGNGRLECVDLASGESRWKTTPIADYWSMTWRDGTILALDEAGSLRLIRATTEGFEQLDSRQVADQETWGHLAVSGNDVFVRELEGIAAWRF